MAYLKKTKREDTCDCLLRNPTQKNMGNNFNNKLRNCRMSGHTYAGCGVVVFFFKKEEDNVKF